MKQTLLERSPWRLGMKPGKVIEQCFGGQKCYSLKGHWKEDVGKNLGLTV